MWAVTDNDSYYLTEKLAVDSLLDLVNVNFITDSVLLALNFLSTIWFG